MSRADRQILAAQIATAIEARYTRMREKIVSAARPVLAAAELGGVELGHLDAAAAIVRRVPCQRQPPGRGCVIAPPDGLSQSCAVCNVVHELTVDPQAGPWFGPPWRGAWPVVERPYFDGEGDKHP